MTTYNLAVIPGPGIGEEVINETVRLLDNTDLTFDCRYFEVGYEVWQETGSPVPENVLAEIRKTQAYLMSEVMKGSLRPGMRNQHTEYGQNLLARMLHDFRARKKEILRGPSPVEQWLNREGKRELTEQFMNKGSDLFFEGFAGTETPQRTREANSVLAELLDQRRNPYSY